MVFYFLSFRKSSEEKVLVITKFRKGHICEFQWLVMAIIQWEGINEEMGNHIYATMSKTLGANGKPSKRENRVNKITKSCICNGKNKTGGASFSFGCSKHLFYSCCKFAKGNPERNIEKAKFQLERRNQKQESEIAKIIHSLADDLSPTLKANAPDAYRNMTGMCLNLRGTFVKFSFSRKAMQIWQNMPYVFEVTK